jgi:hypothetical protein
MIGHGLVHSELGDDAKERRHIDPQLLFLRRHCDSVHRCPRFFHVLGLEASYS